MSRELKPCPHCGEVEHLYPSYRGMGGGEPYAIDCLGCGTDFVPRDGMDVIEAWNRRALGDEMLVHLKRLVRFAGDAPRCDFNEDQTLSWLQIELAEAKKVIELAEARNG